MSILHSDEALAVGTCEEIFFSVWRGRAEPHQLRSMLLLHREFLQRHPRRSTFSMAVVSLHQVSPPDDESRVMLRDHLSLLKGAVTVVEAEGFAGSIIRSVFSGLAGLAGGRAGEIRATVRTGLEYLLAQRDSATYATDLIALEAEVARLRAAPPARPGLVGTSARR